MTKGVYVGATAITDARVGAAKLSAVYVGATEVWQSVTPLQQVILTSGTTWTVPADWDNAHNTIECIGAGCNGNPTGGGGGGGAYAKISNLALVPGASIPYSVGASLGMYPIGGPSWFQSEAIVYAAGGYAMGGTPVASVGDVIYAGGPPSGAGNGGGGAGGPHGAGGPYVPSINGHPPVPGHGGYGDAGYGGAGGTDRGTTTHMADGAPGTEWGTAGAGGGGGGGGSAITTYAGNGGLYGGGGGSNSMYAGRTGNGAAGVIVITWGGP